MTSTTFDAACRKSMVDAESDGDEAQVKQCDAVEDLVVSVSIGLMRIGQSSRGHGDGRWWQQ